MVFRKGHFTSVFITQRENDWLKIVCSLYLTNYLVLEVSHSHPIILSTCFLLQASLSLFSSTAAVCEGRRLINPSEILNCQKVVKKLWKSRIIGLAKSETAFALLLHRREFVFRSHTGFTPMKIYNCVAGTLTAATNCWDKNSEMYNLKNMSRSKSILLMAM